MKFDHGERNPHIGSFADFGPEEFGRGNADDVAGRGRGTKFELAVQDVRIPCKAALPPGVAADYDWVGEGSSRNS